ncbi:MAG: exodeoxyribonuclease VII small subunit [Paludibacteraceae bacterium]|nr:exodeoxyribonuclease VII small subunit [Paludibacteraceae bacterium]
MTYTEKLKRVEEIINLVNSGNIDPAAMIVHIKEAQKLIAECSDELTKLEEEMK